MWSNLFCGAIVSLKRIHIVLQKPTLFRTCGHVGMGRIAGPWAQPGEGSQIPCTALLTDGLQCYMHSIRSVSSIVSLTHRWATLRWNDLLCLAYESMFRAQSVGNHTYQLPSGPLLWPVHLPAWSTLCQHPDVVVACSQSPACHCAV